MDLTYQYADIGDHLYSRPLPPELSGTGVDRQDRGTTTGQTMILSLDFGISDRFAAYVSIPFVASRYEGDLPDGPIDDGTWNTGIQDLGFGVGYSALRLPIMVTPSLRVQIPSHSYETLGHAAIGRDIAEIQLGVGLGWVPRSFLSGTFVQGGYTFAFVEEVDGIRTNRSNVNLGAGYFVTREFVLWASGDYVYTHDGYDWVDVAEDLGAGHEHAEEGFQSHDRLAKKVALTAGGGISYSLGASWISLGVMTTLSGENTHDATILSFTIGRSLNLGG
jgi:hypothetical protein